MQRGNLHPEAVGVEAQDFSVPAEQADNQRQNLFNGISHSKVAAIIGTTIGFIGGISEGAEAAPVQYAVGHQPKLSGPRATQLNERCDVAAVIDPSKKSKTTQDGIKLTARKTESGKAVDFGYIFADKSLTYCGNIAVRKNGVEFTAKQLKRTVTSGHFIDRMRGTTKAVKSYVVYAQSTESKQAEVSPTVFNPESMQPYSITSQEYVNKVSKMSEESTEVSVGGANQGYHHRYTSMIDMSVAEGSQYTYTTTFRNGHVPDGAVVVTNSSNAYFMDSVPAVLVDNTPLDPINGIRQYFVYVK